MAGALKAAVEAGPVWSLGAMSGTSLDGVDAAMLLTDGARIVDFGASDYRPYSDDERAVLRAALGRWPGAGVEAAAEVVETAHAELLAGFSGAAVVGFHGQTLAHDPRGRGTHQAGDGRVLAGALGVPVVWDFRSTDVRMGGEGAPLAPFFHFACAKWTGAREPVVFLNLGGVGNLTWVDPALSAPDAAGACLAFDTGPANAPLNDLMQARRGVAFDEGGALAAEGEVDEEVLRRLLAAPYFTRMPPKSLDRDDFGWLAEAVAELSDADAAATLTACGAAAVGEAVAHCPAPPARVLVTGGGRRNPVMMAMLGGTLDCPVEPVEAVGLDGDMLEAQAFAFLAVRVARGWATSAPGTTGVAAPVGGGIVSAPEQVA
ncbi:anhydro-N-acetylmuramic acid kinase [Tranquillimonas alkanivorans]|uniref:Anhydro-N-acetylmuramic acid kinase n=1 Tax=Tranquillimonas alkanivorans TaxID=441119 RepID=A0A1I5P279_9RHOB|nr:anhydro-N-acetylmuramic acid kinase [Tranquillimonas alkanivorans]SFP27616.1 anhydro-N-acetylmuramic acid kinase [Tranquillimonas alkanivorans]